MTTEAHRRALRVGDVDIDAGVLTIRDAKGGKDRQVPVCEALRARLARYDAQVAGQLGPREWFFPGRSGQSPSCAALKILPRSRRTCSSWRRQST